MQTFLPYPSPLKSADVLDRQRLGKQRVEAKQILNALRNGGGWSNHPAVRMWRGHEHVLALYGAAMCVVWRQRGYQDSLLPWFIQQAADTPDTGMPAWWGDDALHASHRSNLLRKDPEHYGRLWGGPDDLPYVWPV